MTSPANRVLVVGSLHYDIMVDAPHLPARGETVTGSRWYPKFGGKGGNQAVAAARCGCETVMLGAVGGDGFAPFLLDHLEQAGVSREFIEIRDDSASGMSVAVSDEQGDYGAVIVSGVNLEIDPGTLDNARLWQGAGILLLQNEVTESLNIAAAGMARAKGIRVCLNAAPARPLGEELEPLVDILVVNALEARELCDVPVDDLASAGRAAAALAGRFMVAIVTAGAEGVAVVAAGYERFCLPAEPVDLVSTHGAGDVFTGTLCAALASGCDLVSAVRAANLAAARHVSARPAG